MHDLVIQYSCTNTREVPLSEMCAALKKTSSVDRFCELFLDSVYRY